MWMMDQRQEKIRVPYWKKAIAKGYGLLSLLLIVARGCLKPLKKKIAENFQEVKKIAAQVAPDLKIYYGAEIYFTNDILKKLEEKTIPSLAETRFALIEFSMGTPYKEIHTALDRLLHLGITPVVAHIERYKCLEKNEERVQEMIDMGCYMQINSSSVLKPRFFGDEQKSNSKNELGYFLEKDLVHFVASDMHKCG